MGCTKLQTSDAKGENSYKPLDLHKPFIGLSPVFRTEIAQTNIGSRLQKKQETLKNWNYDRHSDLSASKRKRFEMLA